MGPMLKSLHSGPKRGGPDPLDHPPGSAHAYIDIYGRPTYNDRPIIGPTNQACRPIQHLQLGGGLDKTELCSQIIEYKMILVGPYKYYERKSVLVDIITIKTKRGGGLRTRAPDACGGGAIHPPNFSCRKVPIYTPPPHVFCQPL